MHQNIASEERESPETQTGSEYQASMLRETAFAIIDPLSGPFPGTFGMHAEAESPALLAR